MLMNTRGSRSFVGFSFYGRDPRFTATLESLKFFAGERGFFLFNVKKMALNMFSRNVKSVAGCVKAFSKISTNNVALGATAIASMEKRACKSFNF